MKLKMNNKINLWRYIGVMYINGMGILKNLGKAKHWINKAYEGDDAETSKLAKENWDKFELWKY